MSIGPVIIAAGLALFARIDHSGNYLTEILPAVLVFGLGLAINVAPLTSTVLAAVPAEHAGMASAVNNDVGRAVHRRRRRGRRRHPQPAPRWARAGPGTAVLLRPGRPPGPHGRRRRQPS